MSQARAGKVYVRNADQTVVGSHTVQGTSPSGSFNENEAVSWDAGASTGVLAGVVQADLSFQLHVLTGSVPGDGDTITGDVSAATIDVSGTPTADQDWTTSVQPLLAKAPVFVKRGNTVPYFVSSVTSDTELELSGAYGQANAPNADFVIHTSFTSPDDVPTPEQGDLELATIMKVALARVQALLDQRRPGHLTFATDTLSGDGYLDHDGQVVSDGNAGAVMARPGTILAVAGRLNVTSETGAGDIKIQVRKNGTNVFEGTITTSGTGWYGVQATQARGTDDFVAGDRIAVHIDFDTFSGTVAPVFATVEIDTEG